MSSGTPIARPTSTGCRMVCTRLRCIVGVGLALVAAWGCARAPEPKFGSGLSPVAAPPEVAEQERAMFRRLNRDRRAQGLSDLKHDPKLSDVARHHSRDMRDHHFFAHESPNTGSVEARLDAAGYPFVTARENLSEAPDVDSSQDGLLDSPPHHENIMSVDVTHVGIGIVQGGVHDPRNLTVTQVFATPAEQESPTVASRRIAEQLERARREGGKSALRRDDRLDALASRYLPELDATASSASVDRVGADVRAAMPDLGLSGLLVSAQMLPESSRLAAPSLLLQSERLRYGFALRRTQGERGRPALQVLLLLGEPREP